MKAAYFDAPSPSVGGGSEWGIERTPQGTQHSWGKQSRGSRHAAVQDPSKISRSSRLDSPSTGSQTGGELAMWLDRNPQEFLRMVRKSASEPQLEQRPKPKRMPDDPEKGTVRKSEVRASDIIAAQKRADLEKEAKDLLTAERTAYAKQDQHCQLVNQRGLKQTQLEDLKHKAARATLETDLMVGELDALRTRLAMLQHEVKTMEIEMALEVDTTPRYEHMRDRTRLDVEEVANRCMPPTRELAELLTQMTRIGGSHYTEQFAARSLLQAVERLGLQLQARNKYNEHEIAQLQLEKGVTAESKEAVRDIMRRKHESSLQMSGDKTAEEEANLVSVRLPPWVRQCHPAPMLSSSPLGFANAPWTLVHSPCPDPVRRSHSLP